jgi:bacterioferritin (cytochrome b1)
MQRALLSNCNYNLTKQLDKKLQFLWVVDSYINDAENEGNSKCAEIFRKIKADEERHVDMLKQEIARLSKEGKFT